MYRDIIQKVSAEVLGYPTRKHRDWFDENDLVIRPMLAELHRLRVDAIESEGTVDSDEKARAYRLSKCAVQRLLREMKDLWWKERAEELQRAADRRDSRTFCKGMREVHGPVHKVSPAIKSKDGVLLTDPLQVRSRWGEHFKDVLNQVSDFDSSVLEDLPQWDVNPSLDDRPTLKEVEDSILQLASGKAAGEDGIPPEIYIHGGKAVAKMVLDVTLKIWQEGEAVQEFKDANLVHLYKNKGDRSCCDNHRGISLLCIAGKILTRLLLNRLFSHVVALGLIPETQCGFYPGKGTTDMTFSLRQLQEKCKLHSQDLYLLFIDLTKAFDTVHREGLWDILLKAGCPRHFVGIIRSFHDGMKVTVREGSEKSPPFEVTSGTKQGCVIAPTLFSIFFSMMLFVAFKDSDDGIMIKSRPELRLCNIKTGHFNAETKVIISKIRELLFADDCALVADSPEALQRLCDCFSTAARRFGLTISIRKTEVLYQPARGNDYAPPAIFIEGQQLKAVELFKYLGSVVSKDASLDADIIGRIAKATAAFGRLTKRLWSNRDIRLETKVAVYKAAVVSTLLFGCEAWTLTRANIKRLEMFHQTSLRRIARIQWFHKKTNYELLRLTACNV